MSGLAAARIRMQFTRETSASNLIRAFEPGRVRVGERWFTSNIIVTADRILGDWTLESPGKVTVADLAPALAFNPELIVLGTGASASSPDIDLMEALAAQSVGLEIMQTASACRTYNVLVHEGRRVAAALILES